ncbi:hypothetical protein GOV11_00375 [Candidatus Woesearchaeota archaeon]|nr:hypothetical protein [Candidatus Woesearchaeota archaeon]
MNPLIRDAFVTFCTHAHIHKQLDSFDRRYRDLLSRIEFEKSRADPESLQHLEALEHELRDIRFKTA